jgi:hypothetical protein
MYVFVCLNLHRNNLKLQTEPLTIATCHTAVDFLLLYKHIHTCMQQSQREDQEEHGMFSFVLYTEL